MLYIDDLILDQILQKYADQSHQLILSVPILYILTSRDAIRYVHMNVFGMEARSSDAVVTVTVVIITVIVVVVIVG